jgi:hypothetical protein
MNAKVAVAGDDFYRRALEENEAGNNRGRAHNRPRRHAWSFERPTSPAKPAACSLTTPQHEGEVDWYWYIDGRGEGHWQTFCEGCVPLRWVRAEPGDHVGRRPVAWREAADKAARRSILGEEE